MEDLNSYPTEILKMYFSFVSEQSIARVSHRLLNDKCAILVFMEV